jgi:hypothetical protein
MARNMQVWFLVLMLTLCGLIGCRSHPPAHLPPGAASEVPTALPEVETDEAWPDIEDGSNTG